MQMYAWEEPFADRIGDVRNKERSILATAAYIQSLLQTLVPVAPVFAGVLTFSLTAATGNDLTAEDAFTALALFNLIRFSLTKVPRAVRVRLPQTVVRPPLPVDGSTPAPLGRAAVPVFADGSTPAGDY